MNTRAEDEKHDVVVDLDAARAAFEKPEKRVKGEKKKEEKKTGGGGTRPPPPTRGAPKRLPEKGCPVTALGTRDGLYHYLDCQGQIRVLREPEHGRTQIIGLFGGDEYLKEIWPKWELVGKGEDAYWEKKDDFNHGALAPVLISTCHDKGVWDPADKVRGPGSWAEDSGALAMHCGHHVFRSLGGSILRAEAGVSGELLYPRRPALPEPEFTDTGDAGPRILDQLDTWNWARADLDPKLWLGQNVIALIGQAAPWRPVLWVNGAKGTGKSTLARLFEWLHSKPALIMPTNTTQAFVYQKIGDSSLPVVLDEFESKDENNRRMEDVIELMRIAASGGELGRGGSENNPKSYVLKSSFTAFSINMPPLEPQDISRMAILVLKKLHRREDQAEFDLEAPAEHDLILGNRERWAKTGRQLRGRVLQQWPRFLKTFSAYFHALTQAGHDGRGAYQFGALGAGYDIAMHESLDGVVERAKEWAGMLAPGELAETKGYVDEPRACLDHLLAATPDLVRHGTRETVGHYLRTARADLEQDKRTNVSDDACRVLATLGMRVYRDADLIDATSGKPVWWIAISSTHPGLIDIFKGTKWRGRSGTPGAWVRALRGLEGTRDKAREMRIDGRKNWVSEILWDCVFPPFGAADDADEIATVYGADRNRVKGEKDVW